MGAGAWVNRWLGQLFSNARGPARRREMVLIEASPLRRLDPRAKLAMSLSASMVVMLPLERLCVFLALYTLLLVWARLLPAAARQAWRLRWVLLVLFALDWWLIDLQLAVLVSLRLVLLAGTFSLLFATTTFGEFRLAIERLRFPYRFAFSLGLAFQSLGLLAEEWQAIREAQQARGIIILRRNTLTRDGLSDLFQQVSAWVALTIPAVVLTTRRAWAMTESASARGFDSPKRVPFHLLAMCPVDWLMVGISILVPVLFYWRR